MQTAMCWKDMHITLRIVGLVSLSLSAYKFLILLKYCTGPSRGNRAFLNPSKKLETPRVMMTLIVTSRTRSVVRALDRNPESTPQTLDARGPRPPPTRK